VLSIWEDGPHFYRIENNDGKVWLMPVRKLRTAMNLYHPSGFKGKLLKRWFPVLHRLPLLKQYLHIETTKCSLADDLYDKLCQLFNTDRLEFAVFCGAPCVHQKLTIQLSNCKVSDHSEVAELFEREEGGLEAIGASWLRQRAQNCFLGRMAQWHSLVGADNLQNESFTGCTSVGTTT
jgi:hypothetical protein